MADEIPFLYAWLYQRMLWKFGKRDQAVPTKQLIEVMRRTIYQIPRRFNYVMIDEMNEYGLLKKVNSQKCVFLGASAHHKLHKFKDYFLW